MGHFPLHNFQHPLLKGKVEITVLNQQKIVLGAFLTNQGVARVPIRLQNLFSGSKISSYHSLISGSGTIGGLYIDRTLVRGIQAVDNPGQLVVEGGGLPNGAEKGKNNEATNNQ